MTPLWHLGSDTRSRQSPRRRAKVPPAPKKVIPKRPCSKCKTLVQLSRVSRATGAGTTRKFLCAPCQTEARTVCCADCKQEFLLPRASRAAGTRGSEATGAGTTRKLFCAPCKEKKKQARTVCCARCKQEFLVLRASRATGTGGARNFLCAPCREFVCPGAL